jgi:NAD(P)-dependent dehydrogenase (short-subunit alcohol dehydrogenase family)
MVGILHGQAVLVTGAGRGIGRAAALAVAREGASVVVADLAIVGADETAALIRAAGGAATVVNGDVSRPEVVKAWVNMVRETYGRMDCAVKCGHLQRLGRR